ncbi:GntR family transcriptional regulator [Marisediminicola senii]|uniref:GntR family transcriptional regulator n=1 Tax=Marisediminicola senii TaxID=2711233 RepID=UPI0013ECA56B|nr:GntR family transcriptional regulator [Marisediminicola senii]
MWLDELPDNAIDPADRTPLHRQLSTLLRARITDGSLSAGSQLPTEADLQARFCISRSVVRQALLTLSAEGLIQRGRGRGSVVAPRGEHHRLVQRISGLSMQLSEVSTTVLSLGKESDPAAEATLGVSEVLAIRRLRSVDGEPIAVIHTWLPYEVASSLTVDDLTDMSLHATLRKRFDVSIVAGRRQVRGVAASTSLAESLGVDVGAPVLLLEGVSVDASGVPVESFRTWHRADRVVFDIDVMPGSDARSAAFEPAAGAGGGTGASGGDTGGGTSAGTSSSSDVSAGDDDLAGRMRRLSAELAEVSELLAQRS